MEKLKRLKERRAPPASISWVERQIRYLKEGKPIAPLVTKYYRVSKPVATYQPSKAHDVAMLVYEECKPKVSTLIVMPIRTVVHIDINPKALYDSLEFGKVTDQILSEMIRHEIRKFFQFMEGLRIQRDQYKPFDPGGTKPTGSQLQKRNTPSRVWPGGDRAR